MGGRTRKAPSGFLHWSWSLMSLVPWRMAARSHPMDNSLMTRRYAWYVLLVLTAINFINYVDRQIIISLGPFIRRDLQLTYTGFGWLITAFMLIHSLTSLPLGMLSDRWVRHKIIALGVLSWSAATFRSSRRRRISCIPVIKSTSTMPA